MKNECKKCNSVYDHGTNAQLREKLQALRAQAPEAEKARREVEMTELRDVAQRLQNENSSLKLGHRVTEMSELRKDLNASQSKLSKALSEAQRGKDKLKYYKKRIEELETQIIAYRAEERRASW